jgi:hypothetical protein
MATKLGAVSVLQKFFQTFRPAGGGHRLPGGWQSSPSSRPSDGVASAGNAPGAPFHGNWNGVLDFDLTRFLDANGFTSLENVSIGSFRRPDRVATGGRASAKR